MKTAKEWLDENGYKNTEMWSRQGVYEVAIRLQHDHDNELISEIEKKIEDINNFDKSDPTQDYYWQERVAGIKTKALTEIINLIKEK